MGAYSAMKHCETESLNERKKNPPAFLHGASVRAGLDELADGYLQMFIFKLKKTKSLGIETLFLPFVNL